MNGDHDEGDEAKLDIDRELQIGLSKLERDIAYCEKRAADHEMSAREFRRLFTSYRSKKDWREIFENTEEAIQMSEKDAAEYRDLAKRNRETAEQMKMILVYHSARNGRANQ